MLPTGNSSIDHEHEILCLHEQALSAVCISGGEQCARCNATQHANCDATVLRIYHELMGLVVDHFRSEERLMDCLSFEMAQAHKHEHAELSERLAGLIRRSSDGLLAVKPTELKAVVTHWLNDHIKRWDIPLSRSYLGTG